MSDGIFVYLYTGEWWSVPGCDNSRECCWRPAGHYYYYSCGRGLLQEEQEQYVTPTCFIY